MNAAPSVAGDTIHVSVTDESGRPVAGATVVLSAQSDERAVTDRRGSASLAPLSGAGFVTVTAPNFKIARERVDASRAQAMSVMLSPSAGGVHIIGSVTGHGRAPFNATPVAQKIFPREAYRDQGQAATPTVIDQTPGVLAVAPASTNLAAPFAPASVVVRGSLPYETPVTIDGEPVSLASTGTFDINLLPTFDLQEVEVVKGPGDIAGVGSGVGGAVNFRTAEPTAARRAFPETETDSRGGQFSDISYDGTVPGGKLAFASMAEIDGTPCCAPVPSDALRRSLLMKLRYMPTQNITVTGTVLGTNLERSLASSQTYDFNGGLVALLPSLDVTEDEMLRFTDLAASTDRGNDAYALHVYGAAVDTNQYSGSSAYTAQTLDRTAGASFEWQHVTGVQSYGFLARTSASSAEGNDIYAQPLANGSHATTTLLRANAAFHPSHNDEVDLSGGETLIGTHTGATATSAFSDGAFNAPEARAALSHTLRPGLAVRASYGVSAVAPPLDALSGSAASVRTYVGLPAQTVSYTSSVNRIETANGSDVGLEWRLHGNTTTLSTDWYSNVTHNAYMLKSTPDTATSFTQAWFNGPPVWESGVEIALQQYKPVGMGYIAQIAFPRTTVSGANIGGGAWYAPGENDIAPERIPYAQGYTEISYKWPRGSRASLGMLYVGSNNAYAEHAFTTFNSNLELSLASRSKVQISVENLFNALDMPLPLLYSGAGVPLVNGGLTNAQGLMPRTIRLMYRESFGEGSIYEH